MNTNTTPAVWGHADLTQLRQLARRGYDLTMLTSFQDGDITRAQVDLALWALVGRTVDQAVMILAGSR